MRSSRGYPEGEEYSPRGADAVPRSAGRAMYAFALRLMCRDLSSNKLSGTIGSWIGSMAKLAYL